MAGVNKVIILGNVGKDPEIRYTASGSAVANVSLATSESWKDKTTGEKQERTEWHRVVLFGRLAEVISQYVKKGDKLYVEGSLRTNKWKDKETGQDRYGTDIHASQIQLLGGNGSGSSNATSPNKNTTDAPQLTTDDFYDDSIPF